MKKTIIILFFILFCTINTPSNAQDIIVATQEKLIEKYDIIKLKEKIKIESGIEIPNYVDMKYVEYMYSVATELELPIKATFRLIEKESSLRHNAVSHDSLCYGFMQLSKKTYEKYSKKFKDIHLDYNHKNILFGMTYLKDIYEILKNEYNFWIDEDYLIGDEWKLVFASYNAGIGRVIQYKGIPPYTLKYVNDIINF